MDEFKQTKLEILSKCLGEYDILKDPQVRFYCPFCNHKNKKFETNLDTNQFHCWVCGRGGANIERVIRLYGTNDILSEWFERVRGQKFYGGEVDLRAMLLNQKEERVIVDTVSLPPEAKKLANGIPSLVAKHALNYLSGRGVLYDAIRTYDIRFCEEGFYRDRVVFPSYDENGRVNFFVARAIFDTEPKKVLNAKIDRNDIIFNELFITWERPIVLTEGVFDALAVNRNCVPLLGSSLSEKGLLFKKIMHYKPQVILFLDNDIAGHEATIKIAKMLYAWGVDVWHIPWGNSPRKDPGETPKKEIEQLLRGKKRITQTELMRKILE